MQVLGSLGGTTPTMGSPGSGQVTGVPAHPAGGFAALSQARALPRQGSGEEDGPLACARGPSAFSLGREPRLEGVDFWRGAGPLP